MNIERISGGLYAVRDGEREVRLLKGLNRKWTVDPIENLPGERQKKAVSYSEAKILAEGMLRRAGEAGGTGATPREFVAGPKPDAVAKRGKAALTVGDPDTVRLTLAEKLHRLADEILMH